MPDRRYFHPHGVKHGTIDVTTVLQVSYRKAYDRLADQGDDDMTDSFQAKINRQVSGQLVLRDPIQADALVDAASATFLWQGKTVGGFNKKITIVNVEFFDLAEQDQHGALDTITLGWNSFNPDGTDPVLVEVLTS